MTIQTAKDAVQSDEGFIDYSGSWVNAFLKVPCNLQDTFKKAYSEKTQQLEDMRVSRVYYLKTNVYNQIQEDVLSRVIFWREKFNQKLTLDMLNDNTQKDKFNIFGVIGNINLTEGQRHTRKRLYYFQLEKTNFMDL